LLFGGAYLKNASKSTRKIIRILAKMNGAKKRKKFGTGKQKSPTPLSMGQ
jgi:hypothetical protein